MKKKILLKGPLLTRSGYGEQTRFALRSLKSREDLFDIYIQPLQWGATSWIASTDDEREWIDKTIEKTIGYIQQGGRFDTSLQVTIPNEWENLADVNIGYTAGIETTKVAPIWLQKGNEAVDSIIVVSSHSAKVYKDTVAIAKNNDNGHEFEYRLSTPITHVNYPVKTFDNLPELELELSTDFNFLCVAQFGARKNLPNTVRWFIEEFRNEDVGIVLKTNLAKNCHMDRERVLMELTNLVKQFPDRKCKIYLIHGDMTDEEVHALYVHPKVSALLALPHGEGFGLPIFEAAYSGLPVVATGWSGQLDFLVDEDSKEHFYNVSFDMRPIQKEVVWDNVLIAESMWAYPREQSAKQKMRQCYEDVVNKNEGTYAANACEYATKLHDRFSKDKMYASFVKQIHYDELDAVNLDDIPKISLITSVFNAGDHIEQLMEDMTRQTIFESHCEWVILNVNKPGDNYEEEVILKYQEKYPNNIVYKRLDEDPGIYGTWNEAIKMCTGQYVTNVNCDDRRVPWALEKQAKLLFSNSDVDLIYNDSYITHKPNVMWENIEADTQRYNFEQFSKEAMLRGNLPHNNPMWRKSLHDQFGYFNEKYRSAGDWDMWLRCAFGGSRFKKCNEILGIYYFNPKGISTNSENTSWKREEEKEVFSTYFKILEEQKSQIAS